MKKLNFFGDGQDNFSYCAQHHQIWALTTFNLFALPNSGAFFVGRKF